MIYLIKIFLIVISLTYKLNANENNKIIFELNNKVFTNIDYERRIKYIEKINNLKFSQLNESNKKEIFDDYISSLIFYEYSLKNNINTSNLNSESEYFYENNILNENKINFSKQEIDEIKNNIKIDLVRKYILEKFLNSNKNILSKKTDSLDLIYNYNLNYIIINKSNFENNKLKEIKNRKHFLEFKSYLEINNIKFVFKNEDIIDNSIISNNLKKLIINNQKISIITNSNFTSIISLEKNLESYDGIFVKLVNFNTENILQDNDLNCEFLKNINDKIIYKEYEYSKLNNQIKNNLKSVNDFILIKNQNTYNYIFLCELRYDEEILNTINFNKKVNSLANKLQIKFINKYKLEYNFKLLNE